MEFQQSLEELVKQLEQMVNEKKKVAIASKSIYSQEITSLISSTTELNLYISLGLKECFVTRTCLITRIDPFHCNEDAVSNISRMLRGDPPMDENGTPCHLHHIGQKFDAPFVELFPCIHSSAKYYGILHTNLDAHSWRQDQRLINEFLIEKKEHWKRRGEMLLCEKDLS